MKGELDRVLDEVKGEPNALRMFNKASLPEAPDGSIFVGAGDSYAAALAGYYGSDGRCIAFDPYVLASNPQMAKGREVFLISVSGRTSSNIGVARKVGPYATRITALTAVRSSPLATLTNRTVALPIGYKPKTAGMLSFCLSFLAVLKTVGWDCAGDFLASYRKAEKDRGLSFGKGVTYFLGNAMTHPIAVYAAAKTNEMLGLRAQAEQLEEFSHMQLFSLSRSDAVNAFSSFDPSGVARRLTRALKEQRYASNLLPERGSSQMERLFHSVFLVQLSVIREAKLRGFSEPRFLADKGRLRISDSLIY